MDSVEDMKVSLKLTHREIQIKNIASYNYGHIFWEDFEFLKKNTHHKRKLNVEIDFLKT